MYSVVLSSWLFVIGSLCSLSDSVGFSLPAKMRPDPSYLMRLAEPLEQLLFSFRLTLQELMLSLLLLSVVKGTKNAPQC